MWRPTAPKKWWAGWTCQRVANGRGCACCAIACPKSRPAKRVSAKRPSCARSPVPSTIRSWCGGRAGSYWSPRPTQPSGVAKSWWRCIGRDGKLSCSSSGSTGLAAAPIAAGGLFASQLRGAVEPDRLVAARGGSPVDARGVDERAVAAGRRPLRRE